MKKNQAPNKPLYAKNKRLKKAISSESIPSTITSLSATTVINSSTLAPIPDKLKISSVPIAISNSSISSILTSSPQSTNEAPSLRLFQLAPALSFHEFETHIPKWSAEINYKGFIKVKVVNTCTIDYFLFALWVLDKMYPAFLNLLPVIELSDILKKIINNIDLLNWNTARHLWIVEIMKYSKEPRNLRISLFGSEYDMFIKYLLIYQLHDVKQICTVSCLYNNKKISTTREVLMFKKSKDKVILNNFHLTSCQICRKEIQFELEFVYKPNIIFVESPGNLFIDEIPGSIQIGNDNFRLFCTTLHRSKHFIGVFEFDGIKYIVDDLHNKAFLMPLPNSNIIKDNYYKIFTGTSLYFKV